MAQQVMAVTESTGQRASAQQRRRTTHANAKADSRATTKRAQATTPVVASARSAPTTATLRRRGMASALARVSKCAHSQTV